MGQVEWVVNDPWPIDSDHMNCDPWPIICDPSPIKISTSIALNVKPEIINMYYDMIWTQHSHTLAA